METTEAKANYLQMIQAVIDRMANTAAIFKGFAATIVAGVTAISFTEISNWTLLLALLPVFVFWTLDVYYYHLEKKYRVLYEKVRTGKHELDFDINISSQLTLAERPKVWTCIWAPCNSLFYTPMVVIIIIVILLKFLGVI